VEIAKIDAAARGYIAKHGLAKFFGHNLGHGIGLEVHEAPHISAGEKDTVKIRITHIPTKITIGGIEVKKPGSIELSIENTIVMASLRRELYKKSLSQLLKESIPVADIGVFL